MLPDHIAILSDPALLLRKLFDDRTFTRVALLADENTLSKCYPIVQHTLPHHEIIVLPAGEEHKTIESCVLVWQKLTDYAFDRHSCVIAIGGGVLGDLGGFCAATFKRGINFVLMPTTLLAQADASIGGKTGIDFSHFKNHIGVFHEPTATLIATDFLATLPERELRSGFAEVIKHCIISDAIMWGKIRATAFADQPWIELVRHSAEFKSSIVQQDPRENGLRKILNFGHTIGHAIESFLLANGNRLYHGEAIAIGMITESFIAKEKKLMTEAQLNDVTAYVLDVFGKETLPAIEDLLPIILQDKKNKGDQILMALPEGIGKAVWDITVTAGEVHNALAYYNNY